jgi:TfoX/Sxy family transcriptional regulator of competence genes
MAYDEGLAARVTDILGERTPFSPRKMFGGLVLMVDGNMCVGVMGDELIARVGPDAAPDEPGTRPFDMTGRPMRNWVVVTADAIADDEAVEEWVDRCLDFVRTLPPK